MTIQANTRIWRGAVLSVMDDDNVTWLDEVNCIDYSMPGAAAPRLDASTAASTVDQFRLGLPPIASATFNLFDWMDSPFQDAINDMQNLGQTRKFKLVLSEGVRTTRIFTGYVSDQPITGAYNTLWKMALSLRVVEDSWFQAPLIATAVAPTSGSTAGGTVLTITGNGFVPGQTDVTIGGTVRPATVVSPTSLTVTTPAHSAGTVTVNVTTPEKTTANISGGYTYS